MTNLREPGKPTEGLIDLVGHLPSRAHKSLYWNGDFSLSMTNLKEPGRPTEELIDLVWRLGALDQ